MSRKCDIFQIIQINFLILYWAGLVDWSFWIVISPTLVKLALCILTIIIAKIKVGDSLTMTEISDVVLKDFYDDK